MLCRLHLLISIQVDAPLQFSRYLDGGIERMAWISASRHRFADTSPSSSYTVVNL